MQVGREFNLFHKNHQLVYFNLLIVSEWLGAAVGHVALPRAKVRTRFQRAISDIGPETGVCVGDLVGREHAVGRRTDHDTLRRSRPRLATQRRPLTGRYFDIAHSTI